MNRSSRAILRLCEINGSPVEVHLGPGASVLLGEAHPGVDAHHEFSQVLRESLGNHLVQFVVFVADEEPQPTSAFLALKNESSLINGHLPISYAYPVAEGDKSL